MHTGYWRTSYENGIEKKNSGEEIVHSPRLYSEFYSSRYNSCNDLGEFFTIRTAFLFFLFQSYLTPEHWPWGNLDGNIVSKDGLRGGAFIVPSCNCDDINIVSAWHWH